MRSIRARIAAACALTVAALGAGVLALGASGAPAPVAGVAAAPAASDPLAGADAVGCREQSSASFPGAYSRRRNLVAGPLAMIGGASFSSAATVREFGGNKFPLLVRAGHRVTVSVAPSARATTAFSYGAHADGDPDPQHTIKFTACSARRSASRADGQRVTFWSGFVLTSAPLCVPLDVYVDGAATPQRVRIALGKRCAAPLPALRDCASHVEGGKPSDQLPRTPGTIALGPFSFPGMARLASRRGLAHHRVARGYEIKSGVGLTAGVRATLAIARSARSWALLTYAHTIPGGETGRAAVRLEACAADRPAFSYDGPVGPVSGFSGGFILKRPGCVPLEARVAGRPTVRARIPFGVGRCG